MSSSTKKAVLTRESILDLLTEEEVAKVSRAEDASRLIEGDQYIDLTNLAAGVQEVQSKPRTPPGHALPRSAVSDATWAKIVGIVAR